jgi:predicted  nucleic acid-binding Zn-ribbon protein
MSYDIYGNNTNALRQEISELQEDLRAYNRQIKRKDEKIQALCAALQDIVDAYQKHFDAMPVAWQTYDNIARQAIEKATGN